MRIYFSIFTYFVLLFLVSVPQLSHADLRVLCPSILHNSKPVDSVQMESWYDPGNIKLPEDISSKNAFSRTLGRMLSNRWKYAFPEDVDTFESGNNTPEKKALLDMLLGTQWGNLEHYISMHPNTNASIFEKSSWVDFKTFLELLYSHSNLSWKDEEAKGQLAWKLSPGTTAQISEIYNLKGAKFTLIENLNTKMSFVQGSPSREVAPIEILGLKIYVSTFLKAYIKLELSPKDHDRFVAWTKESKDISELPILGQLARSSDIVGSPTEQIYFVHSWDIERRQLPQLISELYRAGFQIDTTKPEPKAK